MNKFKQMDDCGREGTASGQKSSGHFNTLNKLTVFPKSMTVSTSGLDGNVIIWNVDTLATSNSLSQLAL